MGQCWTWEPKRKKYNSLEAIKSVCTVDGTGCWIFPYLKHGSYGRIGSGRYPDRYPERSAHRLAYHYAYGPIPEGAVVRHKCDVRSCCNPEHLEVGTAEDNQHDRQRRFDGRTHCYHGNEYGKCLKCSQRLERRKRRRART